MIKFFAIASFFESEVNQFLRQCLMPGIASLERQGILFVYIQFYNLLYSILVAPIYI